MTLCIKNARHLDAPVDLLVRDGKIVTMTPAGHHAAPEGSQIVDARGLILMPSMVDAHVHLREPGFEYKEDINTGLEAAARGGFGSVMCMANTKPVNDNASVTRFMLDRAAQTHPHGPRLCPIAAATVGLAGEEMAPLQELKDAGCVAISNDGRPMPGTELLRRVMEYGADLGLTFIDHCEDSTLARGWVMNEGPLSGSLGVKGQPPVGEAVQAARDIMLAEYLNLPVHIAHVSSALTVDIIAWGKARGVKVTAETCPHYLTLDESALDGYNTNAKVSPPLRRPEDREALRRAIKDGTIDILATDHAPHAAHEKERTLDEAPCGFTGMDLALTLAAGARGRHQRGRPAPPLERASGRDLQSAPQPLRARRSGRLLPLRSRRKVDRQPRDPVLQELQHSLPGPGDAGPRPPSLAGRRAAVLKNREKPL